LKETLSIYDHVYSRLVVLGADHLYHTMVEDNKEKAEEAK